MCHPARCRTCGKTTWSGCGAHVAQVRAAVPADQWCPGHQDTARDSWIRRILTR
ncbi:hypothetical protein ACFXG4_46245 [Nocardia sp. NPDC059246]|uniref:hypothetical protein n=1 Tax=unclassified Nocardia TaxID=2637762 RepID=UPI0036BF5510